MVINTPDAGWRQSNCLFLLAKNAMDGAWLHGLENENWQSAATLGAPFYYIGAASLWFEDGYIFWCGSHCLGPCCRILASCLSTRDSGIPKGRGSRHASEARACGAEPVRPREGPATRHITCRARAASRSKRERAAEYFHAAALSSRRLFVKRRDDLFVHLLQVFQVVESGAAHLFNTGVRKLPDQVDVEVA